MVLLTMTPSLVVGLEKCKREVEGEHTERERHTSPATGEGEPALDEPAVGKPISHGQIVDLWKKLKLAGEEEYTLENLLRGARVYVPPPPPRKEPVSNQPSCLPPWRRDKLTIVELLSPTTTKP